MSSKPRIYVACLASYNAGKLHGVWIDANQSADDIRQEIQDMLKKSPEKSAEEYAIHDFEGFGVIHIKEYQDIETVSALADAIEEHGRAFELFYSHDSFDSVNEAVKRFSEAYAGEYKSPADWAEEFLNETGDLASVPSHLRYYIDFESYARDASLGGDMLFLEDGCNTVYVFHNNY